MKVVVFNDSKGNMVVLVPADCGLTLEQIARKDVPHGTPYKIIDRSELPSDWKWRNAWVLGEFVPDGIGEGR